MLPWVERVAPLRGRAVVDFGCGNGPVTSALAERAGNVLALDIDASAVEEARRRVTEQGVDSVQFVSGPFENLMEEVRGRGTIDVFLLFAVLEHMTIEERLTTLALARDAVGGDGFIVVCESPNRLLPWDHHTSQLPFFGMLPDELALRYLDRVERSDFREAVEAALKEGELPAREQLIRWGRGLSFHEFELAFADFPTNVVACNYEPELLDVREIHAEELNLARLLKRVRPDIPPAFSRYWIDVVIAGNPVRHRKFFAPWRFETTNSHDVELTEWDTLLFRGPQSSLGAHLDHPTDEIVVGLLNYGGPMDLRVYPAGLAPIVLAVEPVGPAQPVYVRVPLVDPVQVVTLQVSCESMLSFLGYATAS
jgi:SAM-dependent methyltransferase